MNITINGVVYRVSTEEDILDLCHAAEGDALEAKTEAARKPKPLVGSER